MKGRKKIVVEEKHNAQRIKDKRRNLLLLDSVHINRIIHIKYLLDFGYLGHLKINLLVNAYQNLSVAKEGYVCK